MEHSKYLSRPAAPCKSHMVLSFTDCACGVHSFVLKAAEIAATLWSESSEEI